MKIGIVGEGIVGSAVKFGFQKLGHEVVVHDIKYNTSVSILKNCSLVYLCVPTPSNNDGSCNITIVKSCIEDLLSIGYTRNIVIKSTVSPGTTEKLSKEYNIDISFVPEFLRERCAIYDFVENNTLLAIGSKDPKTISLVIESHGNYPKNISILSPTEAELLKYYSNVFNAMRVIFSNEMYEVSKFLEADYTKIKNAYVKYSNIQDIYLDVNDNFRGYAGTCLPKDVKALAYLCEQNNLGLDLFKTIDQENDKFKKTVFEGMRK